MVNIFPGRKKNDFGNFFPLFFLFLEEVVGTEKTRNKCKAFEWCNTERITPCFEKKGRFRFQNLIKEIIAEIIGV